MRKFTASFALCFLFITQAASADNWGHWRGPTGNGTAEDASPPTEWNDKKNIKWIQPLGSQSYGNPVIAEPNMVFFLHMILMDSDSGHAMCFGHTNVVTESGCERLTRHPLELVVR